MKTKQEVRARIEKTLEKHRDKLGDQFGQLVDEISEVHFEYLEKYEALPKQPGIVLDGNAAAQRQLFKEEGLKWVLIKQKYGI